MWTEIKLTKNHLSIESRTLRDCAHTEAIKSHVREEVEVFTAVETVFFHLNGEDGTTVKVKLPLIAVESNQAVNFMSPFRVCPIPITYNLDIPERFLKTT